MKMKDFARISDGLIFVLNTLSVLALLYLVLYELTGLSGQFPAWIYLNVGGNGFQAETSIEVLPLVVVATVFFVTQIYLNYRLIMQKNSHRAADSKS